jgi:hypothetical protein
LACHWRAAHSRLHSHRDSSAYTVCGRQGFTRVFTSRRIDTSIEAFAADFGDVRCAAPIAELHASTADYTRATGEALRAYLISGIFAQRTSRSPLKVSADYLL